MHESDTFIGVLEEGREMELRDTIRRFAKRKLSEPDEQSNTSLGWRQCPMADTA